LVEQLIRNQQVVSSSLTVGSRFNSKTGRVTAWPLERARPFSFGGAEPLERMQWSTKRSGPPYTSELCKEAPVSEQPSGSPYSRVTVKVELDLTDPDAPASPAAGVAVMVAVDVTGLVVELLVVPPQPETKPKPAKSTTSNTSM